MERIINNPFDKDNAKNMSVDDIVDTFVATPEYWQLLDKKNHVVIGSRGSGKTVLAKMLSHQHMSKYKHKDAKTIIRNKDFIGIYLPTNVEWVGSLNNKKWKDTETEKIFFQWRMNVAVCEALLSSLESCLSEYINDDKQRALIEFTLANEIGNAWFNNSNLTDINKLRAQIEHTERQTEVFISTSLVNTCEINLTNLSEPIFSGNLFTPLKWAITIIERHLEFSNDCVWAVCIDEAEFLEKKYQKIINTHMRAHTGKPQIIYKMITMPFKHYTLETEVAAGLNLGDDFEYIYIDHDPAKKKQGYYFAISLINKRLSGTVLKNYSLTDIFGKSLVIDYKFTDWSQDGDAFNLLLKYANDKTKERAYKLLDDNKSFRDQIGRKILPALLLREYSTNKSGARKSGVYSGASMIIRCGDGNPRRLIRIINRFIRIYNHGNSLKKFNLPISVKQQESVLREYSKSQLNRVMAEQDVGPDLYEFLNLVGNYMSIRLNKHALSTEQITSINVDSDRIPEKYMNAIKAAVGIGLLFPNRSLYNYDHVPDGRGTYHLAYVLAPHFKLLPRRGRSKSVLNILKNQ